MRIVLSGASLPDTPLEDELGWAAGAGYDGLELWLPKVWAALPRLGPDALASLLKRRRLPAVALLPIEDATFRDAAGREAVTAAVHGAATLARALGASWVVVQPGQRPDGADGRDTLREAAETLERLCRTAERYDVGVALMPLGFPWASVKTIRQATDIVEAVSRRSLGLALDTFHFHASGSSLEEVKRCRPRAVALLRLGDAPPGDPVTLRDHHRLPPGQGIVPLRAILSILRVLGADPPVVVHAPFPAQQGDAGGWVSRLRERALGVVRDPEPAGRP